MIRPLVYLKEYGKRGLLFSALPLYIGGLIQYYFTGSGDILLLSVVFVLLSLVLFKI